MSGEKIVRSALLWAVLLSFIAFTVHAQLPSINSCYNGTLPVYCRPRLVTFTRRRTPQVNSTCGTPPTNFCERTVSLGRVTSNCSAVCDDQDPDLRHPPSYLTDFVLEPTRWQSENSQSTDHVVSIDFTLGISVAIDVIDIDFESFIPSNFRILKSTDNGRSFMDFHYFAQSCQRSYSVAPNLMLTLANETSVLCDAIASHNPGRVTFAPLFQRPSFNDSVPGLSDALFDFISATDIRLLLVEHYPIPDLPPDDLGYYYALQDISIIGSCQCNGHGYDCVKTTDGSEPARYSCVCGHNTTGVNCERCADFYQDVPWQSINGSNTFECKPCNCNGLSEQCVFDADVYEATNRTSGGVCLNCQENRAGRNCERCADFFYPEGSSLNFTCRACSCNMAGSVAGGDCVREATSDDRLLGDCNCKANTEGRLCDRCRPGHFNLSADNELGCQPCECIANNSLALSCDNVTGSCSCKPNTFGADCDQCLDGFYLPDPTSDAGCVSCGCNPSGSMATTCDLLTGQCSCKPGVRGRTCSEVLPNYFIPGVDHIIREAEFTVAVDEAVIEQPNSFFTGFGYVGINEGITVINFGSVMVPADGLYRVVIRYMLTGTLLYNSSILTITPSSEEASSFPQPDVCTDEVTSPTNIEYTGWHFGAGRSVYREVCLRGGQQYNFSLGQFVSGSSPSSSSSMRLLIDSLVLVPWQLNTAVFASAQSVSRYQECAAAYSSLASVPSAPSYCPAAIFDVSTDIYNGASACMCDSVGTVVGTTCDPLGGQCSCLPNVRGRTCAACYPGTYDLSRTGCTACACDVVGASSPVCEPVTGNCMCLDNVSGRDCSTCSPAHWRLQNPGGCISCNCDTTGSISSQCDMSTGVCNCSDGVTGDLCERCLPDYYDFSAQGCRSCDCHPAGSSSTSCGITSGQCPCLTSTTGRTCSQCQEGTYNLDTANQDGCQPCFCNGRSSSCASAQGLYPSLLSTSFSSEMLMGWNTSTGSTMLSAGSGSLSMAGSLFGGEGLEIDGNSSLYLVAPGKFLGNQLNSYSQVLRVNLMPNSAIPTLFDYDVLLEGGGVTLGAQYGRTGTGLSVQLRETAGWVDVATGMEVSKRQFKSTLSALTRLSVSVSFDFDVLLSSIQLGTAVSLSQLTNSSASAKDEVQYVEQCICPANYTGLSCESCSRGYTRTPSGRCELCRCNGLSSDCDPETGMCFNCSGSATGPSCDVCVGGTYGDPTLGLPCQPCPCPLTSQPGRFTDECVLASSGDVQCINCPPGHTGVRCEICVSGYFGDPTGIVTGTPTACSDCTCSGNIDPSDPSSCDRVTGVCNCSMNTAGQLCERCALGFYGDAVGAKNCTACECDPSGSINSTCGSSSGVCTCLDNVQGRRCSECLPGFYGFGTAEGCRDCRCSPVGSVGGGCGSNGQCVCRPGVTGRRCDQCQPGYYGFSDSGCTACFCSPGNSEPAMCDDVTGQCMCRPGATGSTCDSCLQNYYMVAGICTSCPKCYQDLENVYNISLVRLMTSEDSSLNLTTATANVSPLDDRLAAYRRNVSSLQDAASSVAERQDMLQTLYRDILQSINVTLRSRIENTNTSILTLENDFTTTYILALSAQSLMDVTLNEFAMATNVLNEVERVRIPYLMIKVGQINELAEGANATARELNYLSRNLSSEILEVDAFIVRFHSESALLLAAANDLDWLQQETVAVMEDIRARLPGIGMDARDISSNLTRIEAAITNLEMRFGSKPGSVPDAPDLSRLRDSIRRGNESRVYAMEELLAEIYRQQRNFSTINETFRFNLMRFQTVHATLHEVGNEVSYHLRRITAAYSQAQNITAEGNALIDAAAMVAEYLEHFNNRTFLVQAQVEEAMAKVRNISRRSRETQNTVNEVRDRMREARRNISMAANVTANASQLANASLEVISSINTSSILSAINSSLHSSIQSLSLLQVTSMSVQNHFSVISNLSLQVDQRSQASLAKLRAAVNASEHARNVSSEQLRQVQQAFVGLQPVDETKLATIRELLSDTRAAVDEAGVEEIYRIQQQRLEEQRRQRQILELRLETMRTDMERLRRINATLPTNLPDRCN